MGDFNSEMSVKAMGDFCGINNFTNLVKKHTRYKSQEKSLLTNRQNSFQDTRG